MSGPRLFDIMITLIGLEFLGRLKWKVTNNYRVMIMLINFKRTHQVGVDQ